ncbi:MAG: hypothetical protein Q9157_004814 [Trypethelium eluteriae]
MAKTPKVKKRPVSLRSRAARRDASPSLNTDKSLKNVEPPVEKPQSQANVLGIRDEGITKKKKQKSMSRQQRLRHQKGLERADRNLDKLDRKLATSVQKKKKVNARRANWDDLNGSIAKQIKADQPNKTAEDGRDGAAADAPMANGEDNIVHGDQQSDEPDKTAKDNGTEPMVGALPENGEDATLPGNQSAIAEESDEKDVLSIVNVADDEIL